MQRICKLRRRGKGVLRSRDHLEVLLCNSNADVFFIMSEKEHLRVSQEWRTDGELQFGKSISRERNFCPCLFLIL